MLRLTTLGALDLRDHLGRPVQEALAQPKRVALLVFLALQGARGPVSRDRLLALFWPESDDARARNALSQALHHLRQALGPDVIESEGTNTLRLREGQLWCDATSFGEAIERGEMELALDLYRGEFCPALFVSGAPEAEQWLDEQRRGLRARALAAARTLAESLLKGGDTAAATRMARRALALHPDDEADVRALIALLERGGDVAAALAAYEEYAARLTRELEIAPAPETRQLVEGIRRRREQAAAAIPTGPSSWLSDAPIATIAPRAGDPTGRRTPGPGRPALLATLAVAVLGTAALAVALLSRRPAARPAPARTLAVFPFAIRGGAALGYLSEGMVDLLSAKLEGAAGFHAIDPRSVVAATAGRDSTRGVEAYAILARRLGAGRYISGEIVEVAGRLQVHSALFDPAAGSRPVAAATVSGDTAHLFELVDELTGRILAGLDRGRDTTLARLAALTTSSLPALKAYLEGEQAMRSGRDAKAAEAFRDAVRLDSTFALAEYRLALSASWVTVPGIANPAQVSQMAQLAERHSRRLTSLVRDLLAAYRAYRDFRADEAESRYRRITAAHPDNVEAWFMLGETYFHYNPYQGRSPLQSAAAFERVLALDPTNAHAIVHLARLAARDGQVARLDSLAAAYLARYRDSERTLEMRALVAAVHDDSAARRAVTADAMGADGIILFSVMQAVLAFAQNPDAGRDLAVPCLRSMNEPTARALGLRQFTDLPLAAGQWRNDGVTRLLGTEFDPDWLLESRALLAATSMIGASRARLEALRDSIASRPPYPIILLASEPDQAMRPATQAWLVGLLSIRLGDSAAVRRSLATLAAVTPGNRAAIAQDLARSVRAEQARTGGSTAGALAELRGFHFVPADSRNFGAWGSFERFLMAELLHAQGRDDAALPWYESFPAGYDLPWIAPAHLRQAQIYARLGNAERSRFHYQRLVKLWGSADPELQPLVTEARAALARLGAAR